MKILVGLDFDHTIIDGNSDLYVQKLAPGGKIPHSISELYTDKGWTNYMCAIFKFLHKNKTTPDDIDRCVLEIPLVQGMKELFAFMDSNIFDVVIISDSNSVFIDGIMQAADLQNVIQATYTNPAQYADDGCLNVQYYHTQDWCDMSTVNLCKGHILDEHISQQKENGITYDIVAFVGDGNNDLCPSLRLKDKRDLVLPRIGFTLVKKLEDPEIKLQIQGQVVPWNNGHDIINALQEAMKAL